MCQILGMNCAEETDFAFSLKGFCQRGGATDIHSHGFGLCLYQGRGLQSFHDTLPACKSPVAELVQRYPMRTHNMMAHIRYATQGEVSMENVHPFSRVWKGVQMCFCHNGDCPKFSNVSSSGLPLLGKTTPKDVVFHPVGDTDSEAVFCAILNALSAEFADGLPTLPVLHEFLAYLCDEILEGCASDTIFNFLMGCGQYTLFAYSWPGKRPGSKVWNGLHYIVREPPFAHAKLLDVDYSIDFSTVTTSTDRVAVITTKPLTEETGWTEFRPGELLMFDKGKPYRTPKCCEQVEKEGRGLVSKCVKQKHCTSSPIWRSRRPPSSSSLTVSPATAPTAPSLCSRVRSFGRATSRDGDTAVVGCGGVTAGAGAGTEPPLFQLASSEEVETVLTSPRLDRATYSLPPPAKGTELNQPQQQPCPPLALTASFREERQEKESCDTSSSSSSSGPAAPLPKVVGALEGCLLSELSATNRTAGLYTKVL